MNLIECPKCKKELQEDFSVCPYCGEKTEIETNHRNSFSKIILYIMIFSLCLNLFQAILYFNNRSKIDVLESITLLDSNIQNQSVSNKSEDKEVLKKFAETMQFDSIDTSELKGLLHDGVYKCGVDFKPGDYYIISLCGADAQYDKSNDANEENFDGHKIIRHLNIEKNQYIKLMSGAILVPNELIDTSAWDKYGVFAVGKDLPAGEYKIESTANEYNNTQYEIHVGGSVSGYQILDSTPDNGKDLKCSFLPNKQEYVVLEEGQYIILRHVKLTAIK